MIGSQEVLSTCTSREAVASSEQLRATYLGNHFFQRLFQAGWIDADGTLIRERLPFLPQLPSLEQSESFRIFQLFEEIRLFQFQISQEIKRKAVSFPNVPQNKPHLLDKSKSSTLEGNASLQEVFRKLFSTCGTPDRVELVGGCVKNYLANWALRAIVLLLKEQKPEESVLVESYYELSKKAVDTDMRLHFPGLPVERIDEICLEFLKSLTSKTICAEESPYFTYYELLIRLTKSKPKEIFTDKVQGRGVEFGSSFDRFDLMFVGEMTRQNFSSVDALRLEVQGIFTQAQAPAVRIVADRSLPGWGWQTVIDWLCKISRVPKAEQVDAKGWVKALGDLTRLYTFPEARQIGILFETFKKGHAHSEVSLAEHITYHLELYNKKHQSEDVSAYCALILNTLLFLQSQNAGGYENDLQNRNFGIKLIERVIENFKKAVVFTNKEENYGLFETIFTQLKGSYISLDLLESLLQIASFYTILAYPSREARVSIHLVRHDGAPYFKVIQEHSIVFPFKLQEAFLRVANLYKGDDFQKISQYHKAILLIYQKMAEGIDFRFKSNIFDHPDAVIDKELNRFDSSLRDAMEGTNPLLSLFAFRVLLHFPHRSNDLEIFRCLIRKFIFHFGKVHNRQERAVLIQMMSQKLLGTDFQDRLLPILSRAEFLSESPFERHFLLWLNQLAETYEAQIAGLALLILEDFGKENITMPLLAGLKTFFRHLFKIGVDKAFFTLLEIQRRSFLPSQAFEDIIFSAAEHLPERELFKLESNLAVYLENFDPHLAPAEIDKKMIGLLEKVIRTFSSEQLKKSLEEAFFKKSISPLMNESAHLWLAVCQQTTNEQEFLRLWKRGENFGFWLNTSLHSKIKEELFQRLKALMINPQKHLTPIALEVYASLIKLGKDDSELDSLLIDLVKNFSACDFISGLELLVELARLSALEPHVAFQMFKEALFKLKRSTQEPYDFRLKNLLRAFLKSALSIKLSCTLSETLPDIAKEVSWVARSIFSSEANEEALKLVIDLSTSGLLPILERENAKLWVVLLQSPPPDQAHFRESVWLQSKKINDWQVLCENLKTRLGLLDVCLRCVNHPDALRSNFLKEILAYTSSGSMRDQESLRVQITNVLKALFHQAIKIQDPDLAFCYFELFKDILPVSTYFRVLKFIFLSSIRGRQTSRLKALLPCLISLPAMAALREDFTYLSEKIANYLLTIEEPLFEWQLLSDLLTHHMIKPNKILSRLIFAWVPKLDVALRNDRNRYAIFVTFSVQCLGVNSEKDSLSLEEFEGVTSSCWKLVSERDKLDDAVRIAFDETMRTHAVLFLNWLIKNESANEASLLYLNLKTSGLMPPLSISAWRNLNEQVKDEAELFDQISESLYTEPRFSQLPFDEAIAFLTAALENGIARSHGVIWGKRLHTYLKSSECSLPKQNISLLLKFFQQALDTKDFETAITIGTYLEEPPQGISKKQIKHLKARLIESFLCAEICLSEANILSMAAYLFDRALIKVYRKDLILFGLKVLEGELSSDAIKTIWHSFNSIMSVPVVQLKALLLLQRHCCQELKRQGVALFYREASFGSFYGDPSRFARCFVIAFLLAHEVAPLEGNKLILQFLIPFLKESNFAGALKLEVLEAIFDPLASKSCPSDLLKDSLERMLESELVLSVFEALNFVVIALGLRSQDVVSFSTACDRLLDCLTHSTLVPSEKLLTLGKIFYFEFGHLESREGVYPPPLIETCNLIHSYLHFRMPVKDLSSLGELLKLYFQSAIADVRARASFIFFEWLQARSTLSPHEQSLDEKGFILSYLPRAISSVVSFEKVMPILSQMSLLKLFHSPRDFSCLIEVETAKLLMATHTKKVALIHEVIHSQASQQFPSMRRMLGDKDYQRAILAAIMEVFLHSRDEKYFMRCYLSLLEVTNPKTQNSDVTTSISDFFKPPVEHPKRDLDNAPSSMRQFFSHLSIAANLTLTSMMPNLESTRDKLVLHFERNLGLLDDPEIPCISVIIHDVVKNRFVFDYEVPSFSNSSRLNENYKKRMNVNELFADVISEFFNLNEKIHFRLLIESVKLLLNSNYHDRRVGLFAFYFLEFHLYILVKNFFELHHQEIIPLIETYLTQPFAMHPNYIKRHFVEAQYFLTFLYEKQGITLHKKYKEFCFTVDTFFAIKSDIELPPLRKIQILQGLLDKLLCFQTPQHKALALRTIRSFTRFGNQIDCNTLLKLYMGIIKSSEKMLGDKLTGWNQQCVATIKKPFQLKLSTFITGALLSETTHRMALLSSFFHFLKSLYLNQGTEDRFDYFDALMEIIQVAFYAKFYLIHREQFMQIVEEFMDLTLTSNPNDRKHFRGFFQKDYHLVIRKIVRADFFLLVEKIQDKLAISPKNFEAILNIWRDKVYNYFTPILGEPPTLQTLLWKLPVLVVRNRSLMQALSEKSGSYT